MNLKDEAMTQDSHSKVLLADDHDLVLDGIRLVVQNCMPDPEIFEADNFEDARALASSVEGLDLIILDLFMPGMSGVKSVTDIRQSAPLVPLIVLSSSEDVGHIEGALKGGANGYVPKASSNEIFKNAINLVLAGGIYVPAQVLSEKQNDNDSIQAMSQPKLTDRQTQVLELIIQGKTNKEIGSILEITSHTVKSHIATIMTLLGATNRTQAVHYAQKMQLGSISSDGNE